MGRRICEAPLPPGDHPQPRPVDGRLFALALRPEVVIDRIGGEEGLRLPRRGGLTARSHDQRPVCTSSNNKKAFRDFSVQVEPEDPGGPPPHTHAHTPLGVYDSH